MDLQGQDGLLRTYREGFRNRSAAGVLLSFLLVAFYVVLYFPEVLPDEGLLDGVAQSLGLRSRWYLYGFLYSVAMSGGAIYYLKRHGNSRYNRIRIGVNVGVQIVLGFLLPFVMPLFDGPELYFSYFWPLKYDYFFPSTLAELPFYFALYTLVGSLVAAPFLALRFGKRWYCSWVCGCGGLANTFGDPFRHLTSKSTRSHRFEMVAVHSMLVFAIVMTALVAADFFVGDRSGALHRIATGGPLSLKRVYGFLVGAILAGVVGTGLYPLLGPRVWCRNFCPMAAVLGLVQKAGRFRIRVKPDMCISCGNCSTYCEMGIDVRAYAQRNESFTRAACVGCGMCAHMCPRGVLRLENVAPRARRGLPIVDA